MNPTSSNNSSLYHDWNNIFLVYSSIAIASGINHSSHHRLELPPTLSVLAATQRLKRFKRKLFVKLFA